MLSRNRFYIPRLDREMLTLLSELSSDDLDTLVKTLHDVPPGDASREALIAAVQSAVTSMDKDTAEELVTSLIAGQTAREKYQMSDSDAATAFALSVDLPKEKQEEFIQRMSALLNVPPLGRVAKAFDLLTEGQQIYHGARMFTDVRPLFDRDASESPEAGVILHTLKVDYHASDGHVRSLFVTMDSSDVKNLKEVIDREVEKTGSLQRFLDSPRSMQILERGGEESQHEG